MICTTVMTFFGDKKAYSVYYFHQLKNFLVSSPYCLIIYMAK